MIRYLLSRMGCMMMLFGIIILVVGVAAFQSEQRSLPLLLAGAGVAFLGFLVWNRLRARGPRNSRFSLFKRRSLEEQHTEDNGWEDQFYD